MIEFIDKVAAQARGGSRPSSQPCLPVHRAASLTHPNRGALAANFCYLGTGRKQKAFIGPVVHLGLRGIATTPDCAVARASVKRIFIEDEEAPALGRLLAKPDR